MRAKLHSPFVKLSSVLLGGWVLSACATTTAARSNAREPAAVALRPQKPGEPPAISPRAQMLFDEAVKAADLQKKGRAVDNDALRQKFDAALAADANLAEAEYNMGVLAHRQGKMGEASSRYQGALRRKPSLAPASENLAVLALQAGDTAGGMRALEDLTQQHPDDANSRARLAELYRQTGDLERATELARAAMTRDAKCMLGYRALLNIYLDRKQPGLARLVALNALKVDEADPEILFGLGRVLLMEAQPDKAQVQLDKAVAARPDHLPSRILLANIALSQENYSGAEEQLRRVLSVDGKNAEAHLNLGVAYKGLGQFDKAMQEYDLAERLKPDLASVHFNRALILHKHKDAADRALDFYRKYVAMSGGDVAIPADAPVFALMKEAEGIIEMKAQAARMEAEQKKLEALQKEQERKLKEAEQAEKKAGAKAQNANGAQEPPLPNSAGAASAAAQ
ncbi:MAG: adventurous gliding motility TPR repeat lipoprotein GltE [Myxococcaceae bacterium]